MQRWCVASNVVKFDTRMSAYQSFHGSENEAVHDGFGRSEAQLSGGWVAEMINAAHTAPQFVEYRNAVSRGTRGQTP